MFAKNEIWAYPTDTSFGLGVRADDHDTLERLYQLKKRPANKLMSLMMRDLDMIKYFVRLPDIAQLKEHFRLDDWESFYQKRPRTGIFPAKNTLPKSPFWKAEGVAVRLCIRPEIKSWITYPVTATSANLTGQLPFFSVAEVQKCFAGQVKIFMPSADLPLALPSELWDWTGSEPRQLR